MRDRDPSGGGTALSEDPTTRDRLVEALERKSEELDALVYSLSHDLRAPLRSIGGFSQALLEDYAGTLDDTGRGHLRRVCAAASRMNDQIEGLLRLSRVTRADIHPLPVDLSGITRAAARDLATRHPDTCPEVLIQEEVSVLADAPLMRILMEELLSNAWKFTANEAQPRVEFLRAEWNGLPAYVVRDNGVGFAKEHASKLFRPFQRLHTAEEFPGAGMGLAVVRKIVERHHGQVAGEGRPGVGASFLFVIPEVERVESFS